MCMFELERCDRSLSQWVCDIISSAQLSTHQSISDYSSFFFSCSLSQQRKGTSHTTTAAQPGLARRRAFAPSDSVSAPASSQRACAGFQQDLAGANPERACCSAASLLQPGGAHICHWLERKRQRSTNTSAYTPLSHTAPPRPAWAESIRRSKAALVCGCCSPGAQLHPLSDLLLFIYCVTPTWRLFTVEEVTLGASANRSGQDVPFMIYDQIVFLPLSFNYLFSIKVRLRWHSLANSPCLHIRPLMKLSVLVPTWGSSAVCKLLTHTCGCQ